MATGDKIYLADKPTLDAVLARVNNIGYAKGIDISTGPILLPYPFQNGSAVVYNNEIHILGGNASSGSFMTSHYKFNGISWVFVSTIPYAFYNGSAVVLNNEIHILGGSGNTTSHYKWNGSSWTSVSTLPYAFQTSAAVVYNNEIHILGSSHSTYYTAHYKFNGTTWVSVSTAPGNMYNGSAVVLNNVLYAISANLLYAWDGSRWTASTIPIVFSRTNMIVYNNEIHLLGGSQTDAKRVHYRLSANAWVPASTLPFEFEGGSVVVYNNKIHILGSMNSLVNHRILNDSLTWEVHNSIRSTKYYLLKGTKIYCNNSKTIISSGATKTSYGYLIDTTGVINISYTDEDSRCFYIV